VIGIGAGDPEYLTVQAVQALRSVDVLFLLEKGADDELAALRRAIVARYVPGGLREVVIEDPPRGRGADAVAAWRAERFALISSALRRERGVAAFLAWGDPSLYDGLITLLEPFSPVVIPGISAVSALAARHGLVLNRVGGSVLITTGRRLAASGFPAEVDDVVVMLDAELAFLGLDGALEIYWGAYLGTPDELLIAGRLGDVREEIARVRSAARERKGWMFDTYLLRRT